MTGFFLYDVSKVKCEKEQNIIHKELPSQKEHLVRLLHNFLSEPIAQKCS